MLHQALRTFIDRHRLLDTSASAVIVGVSGGADSVALLHLLVRCGYNCIAAHCNFRLRGDESEADKAFVQQMAERLHIPFRQIDFETRQYARQQRLSIEMAARELRYRWFDELRIAHQAQAVAVAHHRDDSIETLLLNLIRGTGIRGLTGIRPRNGHIVRPMLCTNRSRIVEWLDKQQLEYRTDTSNLSDEYARNFIRLRLLPLMQQLNPSVAEAIFRTAEHLADTENIYDEWLTRERKRVAADGNDSSQLAIDALQQSAAPATLLFELLRPYGFNRTVANDLFDALDGESGRIFDAAATGYRVVKDRDRLLIGRCDAKETAGYTVGIDGRTDAPIRLRLTLIAVAPQFTIDRRAGVATLDADRLQWPLTLRTWRRGDRFVPLGMRGQKKLSDYFTDRKFSLLQKERTWLLCNGDDIVWIVGERIDNRYRITDTTRTALVVEQID